MKMNLKTFAAAAAAGAVAFGALSCTPKETDNTFKGSSTITISTTGVNELVAEEGSELKLDLLLNNSFTEDVTIPFAFENGTVDGTSVVKFVGNPVTFKAGSTTASITVVPENFASVQKEMLVKVVLAADATSNVKLATEFRFTLKPASTVADLTPEQIALIEGYKADGLDLMHWIGKVPVKVEVSIPGDGNYEPYLQPQELSWEGVSVITLSENATAEKPVLKMVDNAMGLGGILYDALRNMTVLNSEFWVEQPMPQKTMELIGLSAESDESFELGLDDIALNTADKSIDYVSDETMDIYGDTKTAVNFIYSYSAWDRLKKLIDDGNQEAIEAAEGGGSVNPAAYINYSGIDTNEWDGENWFQYTSSFDSTTGVMIFEFPMDFEALADYMKVYVTYSSAK